MVNYHDPAVVEKDFSAMVKLWYTVEGLYIWEFFNCLGYEWSVIRKRRPYHRSIWIYSFTRIATLVYAVLNLGGFAFTRKYNCQVWIDFELSFAYLALSAASLLIVLRIIAIWNRNKVVLVFVSGAWTINLAFLIQDVVRLRAAWSPAAETCAVLNMESTRPYLNIIVTFATDVVLLLVMLMGLLRSRRRDVGFLGLGLFLWKQGVIWLVLATVAAVVPTVFVCLNLNDPFNRMFEVPSMIAMSIAATRMHLSLVDYSASNSTTEIAQKSDRATSKLKGISNLSIPLDRMQVSITTEFEQYPPSETGHNSPQVDRDEHLVNGVSLGDDLESAER